jgi:hypothetical protein
VDALNQRLWSGSPLFIKARLGPTGGVGYDGVRNFYRDLLIGKFFPPDVKMTDVSRTVDEHQIVDELVISFTHTTMIDWMLPSVAPTGKPVEVAFAVIVGFKDHLLGPGQRAGADRPARSQGAAGKRR